MRSFSTWADSNALRFIDGSRFREVVQHAFDKASALELIATSVLPDVVMYCGDDSSDEPALAWAAARGEAFFVRSSQNAAAAGYAVDSVDALWRVVTSRVRILLPDEPFNGDD
jgi:trehalose-6-phosphatase